ncbi:DUF551 domain-containing protein [Enterobacter hormaechei]|nr:DUF551 domain-containing protein [Enterobacter hormaechei]
MTLTKSWLQKQITDLEATRDEIPFGLTGKESKTLAAFKLALASLEAEPVGYMNRFTGRVFTLEEQPGADTDVNVYVPVYAAPPAPVSVPAAMEMDDDFDSAFEHGKAVGWNAYRAAMLQGADGTLTNEGTIPVTQFKPVADLYGLTSPTGGETSFTFDAVEARDFIDGGWSCQEYVELERFQEAITNHTEDKLAMVDHSGDSNNMVEPVTTAYKLQDGWVACSERMPEGMVDVITSNGVDIGKGWWDGDNWKEWNKHDAVPGKITHWMPMPAAPQQEVK